MVATNDGGLRPADLGGSEPSTKGGQQKTSSSRKKRTDIIGFDVFKSVKDEEEQATKSINDEVRDLLKRRANNRLTIRKSNAAQNSQSQKDRRTSTLVDLGVQMLNDKGISSGDLQPYIKDASKGMELIDNIKAIDNGRYSGEIDNYINGLSPDDGTGLFVKIFPDYAEKFGYGTPKQENKVQQALQSGEMGLGDKIGAWTRNTALGRTTKSLVTNASNLVLGAANDLAELALGGADLVNNVIKGVSLQSPDSYLNSLTSSQGKERYDELVNAGKYNGSYDKWVEDAYNKYSDLYNKTMGEEGLQDKYKEWRDSLGYDENAWGTQVGGFGTDVATFFGGDYLAKKFLNFTNKAYKGYKLTKAAKALKGAEEVGAADLVKAEGVGDLFSTLSSKTEKEMAGGIFDKISNAFAQSISEGGTPTALSRALEGIRMGTEMQGIEDIKEGELSKPAAYAFSALANSILNVGLGAASDIFGKLVEPNELVKTSASRLPSQQIDQYTSMAKKAATEPRAEHPLAYVYNKATNIVKKKIDGALKSAGAKLGNIRKNLPQSNLQLDDAIGEINKGFSNNNMGIRIVGDAENGFKVEGVTSSSEKTIEKIVNKINSIFSERKFKLSEGTDLPNNTQVFENFYTALKRIGWTAEKTDKPMFEEIEKAIRKYLDDALGTKAAKQYADALAENAELYGIQDVVPEIEGHLKALNTPEGGGGARLSNGMSLTEYSDLLEKYGFVKNLLEQREVAAYLQAYYNVPMTVGDRAAYPSLAGLMERGQTMMQKLFSSPEGNNFLRIITPTSKTLGRPLSVRGKGNIETRGQKIYGAVWDAIGNAVKGKTSTTISEGID